MSDIVSPMTHIELEISNPCNEHCIHCYRVCNDTRRGFLSAQQAKSVLEQASALGASSVTITGGESLLNPEWKDIVQTADELGFRILFFSNGSRMTENDADFLLRIKNLKEVQFSLYALDENIHDEITRLHGSCAGTKNAIRLVCERNIPLFISIPVMKENKNAALDVMRWCDDNEIPNCADIFIFGTSDYRKGNASHRLSRADYDDFFEATMKDAGRFSYIWGKSFGKQNLSEISFYNGAASLLCVSGDGTIYPMIGWYEPLGNISTDSLETVYKTHPLLENLRKIKVTDIPECNACNANDFCDFCCLPHITANKGELGKLDSDFCHFVRLRKQFANRRDALLKTERVL